MNKILILSDDRENSIIFTMVFEQDRIESLTVTTTQDALFHLKNSNVAVLVLILPLWNSEENGWDFYRNLKTNPNFCQIPVIVYTAWFLGNLPDPRDYGDELFTMPLAITKLRDTVKEFLRRDKRQN